MSRSKIICALGLSLVVVLTLTATASAAKKLDLVYYVEFLGKPFEEQVEPGARFASGSPQAVSFESSVGVLKCSKQQATNVIGETLSNNLSKDQVTFEGTLVSTRCESTIGLGKEADVSLEASLEATLYLGSNLKAEIKGPYAEYPNRLRIFFFGGGAGCNYTSVKLKAALALEPVGLTFAKAKFKLVKTESNLSCPKSMTFNAVMPSVTVTTSSNRLYGRVG